ncbi:putative subtilisin [Colletotrichum sp. SAR11_239]|nr:putative subtilisin [Colletotrichum sp. SAR11_239]
MDRTSTVGIGPKADSVDQLDFAKYALSLVSHIAVSIGADHKLCAAGGLAAKLYVARKNIEAADLAQSPEVQRRIPKLLRDLERVCAWPEPPDPQYRLIRSLVNPKGKTSNDQVRRGILSFVTSASPNVIDQYFKNLDRFSKQISIEDDDKGSNRTKTGSNAATEDYPAHVNAELYAVLKSHSLCTCFAGRPRDRSRHHARLRLRDDVVKDDEQIIFDMLFSESPTVWDYWQDLQFRVSVKKAASKAVKFSIEGGDKIAGSHHGFVDEKMKLVKPTEFCSLVNTKLGSQIRCHVQDSELRRFHDGFPVGQDVESGPSISLQSILRIGRLSNRMKLVLAYIVARSYWQYYDSPWMNSPWTSDTIHFLCESQWADGSLSTGALYASKPYFVVEFEDHDEEVKA